jgi:hypothetical protein
MNALLPSPFRRDGHLSDPGAEAIALGLVDSDAVRAHLAACEDCRARVEALRAAPPPPAWAPPAPRVPEPANRPMWSIGALVAAMCLFVLLPQPPEDGRRFKGDVLSLDVFADEGRFSRRLGADDELGATDRIGFKTSTRSPGWLMVVGIDQDALPYPCFPQDDDAAVWTEASADHQLPAAIRLDGSMGQERIVGLLCDHPIRYGDVEEVLVREATATEPDELLPPLIDGCVQEEVRLTKRERP